MMRFIRNITLMASMILAMVGCEKMETPSKQSNALKFRVTVEKTKANDNSDPGPDYFYLF